MMENLQQIVVQITTAPFERALAQYGNTFMPDNQIEIIYSDLSVEEKLIWDNFVEMIKNKN
jgi:hypothetical protein